MAVNMNTYTIKFLDKTIPDRSVEADDFSPPDEEWGLVLFYTASDRSENIIYAVSIQQIFSIAVQAAQ